MILWFGLPVEYRLPCAKEDDPYSYEDVYIRVYTMSEREVTEHIRKLGGAIWWYWDYEDDYHKYTREKKNRK
jgi:hypothetical protein